MKHKIFVLVMTLLICLSTILIIPSDLEVEASGGGGGEGESEDIGLNFSYIEEITYDLSQVIFNAYDNNTEIRKGRYFGSKGEIFAAKEILQDEMIEMGLYNPCSGTEPYLEKIENINAEAYLIKNLGNLTDDLQPLSYGMSYTYYSEQNITNTTITDFHIEPKWNLRIILAPLKAIVGPTVNEDHEDVEEFLELLGLDNPYWYNMIFNESMLTKNVSYSNLKLLPRPTDFSWMKGFLLWIIEELCDKINDQSITDFGSLMAYILPEFQEHYGFTFGELNPGNASGIFDWYEDQWYNSSRCGNEDFLYIAEDNAHNPNATGEYYYMKEYFKSLLEECPDLSFIWDAIIGATVAVEMLLWNLSMPNCKGLIKFNHDNNTYDMQGCGGYALNTLYINGTTGTPINASKGNYTISFYIDQNWTQDVESYNVIGQINGTDQNKTVILSGLYDCWYNQGTVDGAIGTAIVMGIAKYMQDNEITPKYNLKFICFGGEEAGPRGAYYYDENIMMKTFL